MWGPRMGPGDPAAAAALAGMLPFDSIGLYEQPKPRFIFKMPRVVPDQKSKFESDELFRRLSRESEVNEILFSNCNHKLTTIFLEIHTFNFFVIIKAEIFQLVNLLLYPCVWSYLCKTTICLRRLLYRELINLYNKLCWSTFADIILKQKRQYKGRTHVRSNIMFYIWNY